MRFDEFGRLPLEWVTMINTRHATEGSVANWSAPPHTIAKERIVRKHAELWGLILGRHLKKLRRLGKLPGPYEIHYVDAFAGPGEYDNGVLGSPVQALQGLVDAASMDADGPVIFFWAVERNPDTVSSLHEAVAVHTTSHPRVKVSTLNLSFRDAWDEYQQRWDKNTFLLLDGFGWQASVPDMFRQHMSHRPGNSALWSLMVRSIIRFGRNPDKRKHMDRLFGPNGWSEFWTPGTPHERRRRVISRARDIAKSCGAKHVVTFDILRKDDSSSADHHEYTLLYMGHALEGCNVLKQAFWNIDPVAGAKYQYQDPSGCQLNLLSTDLPDALLEKWGDGHPYSLGEIADWLKGDGTRFCWTDHNWRSALANLRDGGHVVFDPPCPRSGPGSRGGFGIATASERNRTVVLNRTAIRPQGLPLERAN